MRHIDAPDAAGGLDKQPEIVPEEAAIVERIYEMFLAGQPVKVIAQTLQAEKNEIPGKNLSFSKNMIMNILRNEKYCGDCILQKTVTIDCFFRHDLRLLILLFLIGVKEH